MSIPATTAGEVRRRLRAGLVRLVDVVTTDLLVWDAGRRLRPARALVDVRIVELGPGSPVRPADVLDAERVEWARPFLRRGDSGYIAIVDERVAGWIWLSRTSHRDPWSGFRIGLAPDEAYAYALWVEPDFRPKGVPRLLMTTLLAAVVSDERLRRVYGWVDQRNRESQMLLRLLGFADVQSMKRVRIADRVGLRLPLTDHPRFGPLSRRGRHNP